MIFCNVYRRPQQCHALESVLFCSDEISKVSLNILLHDNSGGSGRSARTVGWALNACHNRPDFIPAHRVVNHQGLLTGKHHFGNSTTMEQLLANEGIVVENDKVIDFREKFWDPSAEIDPFDLE